MVEWIPQLMQVHQVGKNPKPSRAQSPIDGWMDGVMDAIKRAAFFNSDIFSDWRTYARLLQWCMDMKSLADGKLIHAHMIKTGFKFGVFVKNRLVNLYVECGNVADARRIFDKMPNRNVFSWNAMIAGYVKSGGLEEAHELFEIMPERDEISWNTMIAGHSKWGSMEGAQKLFDVMPRRNEVSWTTMIAGYAQNGHTGEALKLFCHMQRDVVKMDQVTLTSVLNACSEPEGMEHGKQLHAYILQTGFDSNLFVGSAIVDLYAKCGSITDARKVFNKMPERNVVSWNTMISGYAHNGCGKDALKVFEQMKQIGVEPNQSTFVGVLSACSHAGLVDEGRCYFDSMSRNHGITPTVDHYACLVDLLGRAGHLDEAASFIINMPFDADAVMWGSLLSACRSHGNLELGRRVAERLFVLEPLNAGPYMLLSNMYAAVGDWDNVTKLRKIMIEKGVKKKAGCSWIEGRNCYNM